MCLDFVRVEDLFDPVHANERFHGLSVGWGN